MFVGPTQLSVNGGTKGMWVSNTQPLGNLSEHRRGAPQPHDYGLVVRELHATSPLVVLQQAHNHAACAYPSEHRWKAVEQYMREVLNIKATLWITPDRPQQVCFMAPVPNRLP